jgi:LacI family transcriptional regulator
VPRIVDVAAAAEVSVATVSRVLNGSAWVDPVLTERVRAAADRLGYRPNGVARNLRQRGTRALSLIVTNINNPFYTAVARGVEDAASEAGYSVLLCDTDEDRDRQNRYLEVSAQERVAGVVLVPRSEDSDVSALHAANIPLVVVDRRLDGPADFVTAASFEGAVEATEHLLSQGWQRPACLSRPADIQTGEQRRLGYQSVVVRHGLQPIVRRIPYHAGRGRQVIRDLLAAEDSPDSLITIDSMLALDALEAAKGLKLRVGQELGIITFDDADWTRVVDPPLSVVAQPAYDIGTAAVQLLIRRIRRDGNEEPQRVMMNTELIIRGSSVKARDE